jgi:hypothetical protein
LGEDTEIAITFNAKVKLLTDTVAANMADIITGLAGEAASFIGTTWVSGGTAGRLLVGIKYTDGVNTWDFGHCNVTGTFTEGTDADTLAFTATCPHPYPVVT